MFAARTKRVLRSIPLPCCHLSSLVPNPPCPPASPLFQFPCPNPFNFLTYIFVLFFSPCFAGFVAIIFCLPVGHVASLDFSKAPPTRSYPPALPSHHNLSPFFFMDRRLDWTFLGPFWSGKMTRAYESTVASAPSLLSPVLSVPYPYQPFRTTYAPFPLY